MPRPPTPATVAAATHRRFPALRRSTATTLQINLGRLCNQACRHCHVDSSPARTGPGDNAGSRTLADALELLRREPRLQTVDLTGGAPELNPGFRALVKGARALGRRVLVRHNLTVQFEPGQDDLPAFFGANGVVLFCSLPCYLEENVERQRGRGVFAASIRALRRLNDERYGLDREHELNLVFNPQGPSLPPPQAGLERDYRSALRERHGVEFTSLVTITNQPIHRFRNDLVREGRLDEYFELLEESFNPSTLDQVMCRSTLSVRWDGALFDCDFNLVQDLPMRGLDGVPLTLRSLLESTSAVTRDLPIAGGRHCFACTAGCGSSCGGALQD